MGLGVLKWGGTILCLIGIALTSVNHYPLNIVISLVGSSLWMIAGMVQRDMPLFLVEAVAAALYFAGFAGWLLTQVMEK